MIEHPYAKFLISLERPGRYVGAEFGSHPIPEHADVRALLAFPDSYEIGMSHIGLSVLYEAVGKMQDVCAERVFMPWPDLEAALRENKVPLVSLEAARPLCEFDLVGFSLQYELTYTNLLAMLDLGRIPRHSHTRGETDPIVVVGGPLAAHCEPVTPFVDICVIGDGEESLPAILKILVEAKKKGLSRKEKLLTLDALPFAYAPGAAKRVECKESRRMVVDSPTPLATRACVESLGEQPAGCGPVPTVEAVFDRYSVEIARGCTAGCRFCQAGFCYRPVRERSREETTDAVDRAVGCLGFDDISLASLSTADHSRIAEIISSLGDEFTPKRVSLAVPSLRAYGLEDKLVEVLSRMRKSGVTLAPEAGSQRLRDMVNKNVTEDDLFVAATRFFDWGFDRIKLYFMLGLPTETDQDLEAMVDLATRLRDLGRRRMSGRHPTITISVSTFVPKPFTPLQRETMIGHDEIIRRQQLIEGLARKNRLNFKAHDPRLSILEGIFCRGDASLATKLEQAVDMGARFDGWDEMFKPDLWKTVLEDLDISGQLAGIPDESTVPWDHVDIGVSKKFMAQELERARQALTTTPCGRFGSSDEDANVICHSCGVRCSLSSLPLRAPRVMSKPEQTPPPERKKGRPQPRKLEGFDESKNVRVRLFMAKWGRQAFVGHLDTMRHVMRSLRRAGLELVYTQGFHPKPKLVACPPLPLGVSCISDPMDVFLVSPPDAKTILEKLRGAVPGDLEFVGASLVEKTEKALSKQLRSMEYVASIKASSNDVKPAIDKILAAKEIIVERVRKRQQKTVDIRPWLLTAELLEEPRDDLRLPPSSDRVQVIFTLELPPSGGARADEIVRALELSDPDPWIVRTQVVLEESV